MDRETELEQVDTAFFLERTLAQLEDDKEQLEASKPQKPRKPRKPMMFFIQAEQEIEPPPIPEPNIPFPRGMLLALVACGVIPFVLFGMSASGDAVFVLLLLLFGILLWIIGIPLCLIFGFMLKKARINQHIEDYKNSPAYQRELTAQKERLAKKEEKSRELAYESHEEDLWLYENVQLPSYKNDLAHYERTLLPQWEEKCQTLQAALDETKAALQEVYDQNVIPGKYRNLAALAFISAFMGTSRYDLKFAIEQYNDELHTLNEKLGLDLATAQQDILEKTARIAEYNQYLIEQSLSLAEQGNRTLRSLKRWSTASAAIQGYSAFTQQRLLKTIRNMNEKEV